MVVFIDAKGVCMIERSLDEVVIGCAIEVHRHLGPGLLESSYERCLMYELGQKNIFDSESGFITH